MKKVLGNGVTIVCKSTRAFEEMSLTFKCGHVNEPVVGIAGVYEKLVLMTSKFPMGSIFGGSMTSFVVRNVSGTNPVDSAVAALFKGCVKLSVTKAILAKAVEDIVKHTEDSVPLPERQVKLAYKHTAFGNSTIWSIDEYIAKLEALTVDDVKKYIADNFVGNNVVIAYSGKEDDIDKVAEVVQKYFGNLPKGDKNADCTLDYTGGIQIIPGVGGINVARLGWNLPKEYNTAETNILMSMLAGRLERSLAEQKNPASAIVKIAGYFGLRTLCVTVTCPGKRNFDAAINILLANIKRLQLSEASDRRMETTRSRAATERLCVSNEVLPRSVEAAWALLGRNIDYDADSIINNMYDVNAHDVKIAAREIFSQKPTAVFYTRKPYPSYEKIVKAIACDNAANVKLTPAEKAAMEAIDASNPA